MIFTPTGIQDVTIVELEPRSDERGHFARAWCAREFAEQGIETPFVQANVASSKAAGTLRGLHYQDTPHAEAKLVRCTAGAIFDVAVDVRPASPTYLDWFGVSFSAANGRMLYLGTGIAHGYQALTDDAETYYLVSAEYAPSAERGLRWDDPALGIEWPLPEAPILSPKDRAWPLLDP